MKLFVASLLLTSLIAAQQTEVFDPLTGIVYDTNAMALTMCEPPDPPFAPPTKFLGMKKDGESYFIFAAFGKRIEPLGADTTNKTYPGIYQIDKNPRQQVEWWIVSNAHPTSVAAFEVDRITAVAIIQSNKTTVSVEVHSGLHFTLVMDMNKRKRKEARDRMLQLILFQSS